MSRRKGERWTEAPDEKSPYSEFLEKLEALRKDQEWIDQEAERLGLALERTKDELRYALITAKTPADVTRIEGKLKDLETQVERALERKNAFEEAAAELNKEVSENPVQAKFAEFNCNALG